jgi:four helix bundle protein
MAKRIEELPVYQHAVKFCDAISEILERPALRRNRKLWDQIAEANDSILANMKEGFEQSSDDAFANMLTYAKGSCAEVVARSFRAHRRQCLTAEEYAVRRDMGEQLQRMLGGFIKYLRAADSKSAALTDPSTPTRGSRRRQSHPHPRTSATSNLRRTSTKAFRIRDDS